MKKALGVLFVFSIASVALLASSTAVAQALPVRDTDFGCVSKAKADQYVRDFGVDLSSFGGVELCNAKIDSKKLFNDLRILEEGAFGQIPNNNLVRGFIPMDQYYSWMKSETRGIQRGQDVPYATAYNSGGYFTMQDGWAALSTLGRIGTVVHEARHTEGYTHIGCSQGPYMSTGVPGCDRDYTYGGSHAIEMEYYARVSVGGSNFHPVYKKMARLMAMGRANFVFNQPILKMRETLLAIGNSGRAYLFNQNKWIEREAPQGQGKLKRSSAGGVLLSESGTAVFDPYANSGFPWNVVDDFSYFKLMNSDRLSGQKIADFEEVDLGKKRYAFVLTGSNQYANFNYRGGTWNNLLATPKAQMNFATATPKGDKGLFLIDANKNMFSVDLENPQNAQAISTVWPSDAKTFVVAGSDLFQLSSSGDVQKLPGTSGGAAQNLNAPERIEQLVSIPLYDAFEVEP